MSWYTASACDGSSRRRRIGLGDWRPEKSRALGRFETERIKALVAAGPGLDGRVDGRGLAARRGMR